MAPTFSMVYGTNVWSHHQVPVATELARILGPDRFRMALFDQVDIERRNMGWGDHAEYPWVIGPPLNADAKTVIMQQCLEADVMVFGSCPSEILQARAATNKLTLVSSERLLKKGYYHLRMLNPRYAMGFKRFRAMVNHPNVHALAIGRYAPADLRTIGAFGDRIWKWGYFVDVNPAPPGPLADRPLKLLWVGRMLDWKNVNVLLRALARIQNAPWFGECVIVGDGPERSRLLNLGRKLRLNQGRLRFLPSVPFEEIRRLMRDSDVYVLPSNCQEGWGAVAGEAMSEGCVLVANAEAGSSRELVVDGEYGFLYQDGNIGQLAALLERLGNDYPLRMKLRRQAWERMQSLWHPRVAAERLVTICQGLLEGAPVQTYVDGPCSRV
ncbi:MAG: glycosyltransferase family 4 protein [Desulfuromonadales bacterium]|nr:glycosyltransferase family 4 protein [Desulfuromonadales bacterium]